MRKFYNIVKSSFQKGADILMVYPNRRQFTGTVSPQYGEPHGVGPWHYPDSEGYKDQLDEVLEVRDMVERNIWPKNFLQKHYPNFLPGIKAEAGDVTPPMVAAGVSESNPKAAARLVRMDLPSDLGNFIFDYLVSEDVPFRHTSRPKEFVDGKVLFNLMLWTEIHPALKKCFEVKYYYGFPRPEEYVGAPGCLITSYDEGCPDHPAFPAGHAAVAGATQRVVERFFDLNDHQTQLRISSYTSYQFAQYREFAGVHFVQDNIEGLRFGYTLPNSYQPF